MIPRLDLLCPECYKTAFTYCVGCEARDVQARSDFDKLDEAYHNAQDALYVARHPDCLVRED